jgi:hypothetical protein
MMKRFHKKDMYATDTRVAENNTFTAYSFPSLMFLYRTCSAAKQKESKHLFGKNNINISRVPYHFSVASRTNLSQVDILVDHLITIFILNMTKVTTLL